MGNFQDLSCSTLPLATFEQLGQLLQQMAQAVGAVVLTEAVLSPVPMPAQLEKFNLVVSAKFSALLVGTLTKEGLDNSECYLGQSEQRVTNIRLTFEKDAIALFLSQLSTSIQHDPQTYQALNSYQHIPQVNDAKLQSEFTLLLLSLLQHHPESTSAYPFSVCQDKGARFPRPNEAPCQPVEDALRQQIAHEQILNQVTTQIRRSMELPTILTTAVNQVREFLQTDRLVIYQFEETGNRDQGSGIRDQETRRQGDKATRGQEIGDSTQQSELISLSPPVPPNPLAPSGDTRQQHSGYVTYEARATGSIPSVLNYKEENCFLPNSQCWEKYRQGFTLAIDDVEKAYILSKCFLGFLRATKVRAKLAAPIVVQDKLWGLLIAHQCAEPRHWLDSEINLLKQIAEQLAIAIYQTQLMQSLKQEKQTLEQRVIERTQALHEALIAAQAANRAKSEFLATMSHELRSPLTRIIGMSSTLLRWSLSENQRQRNYLQTIYDSGQHLLALINDILELSQLEAGKAVLNVSEFSLVKFIQACVCSHSPSCGESLCKQAKNHAVNLELDLKIASPSIRFRGDPQRVRQILWNLVSNAVKFTPQGGKVILRVWLENDTAVLQVEDTGIGIPEHQLPLLFEKFQQLHPPHCRLYEGTGLGLALTKQLVELHQGQIKVRSTVGSGSTFTVWLPAIAKPK